MQIIVTRNVMIEGKPYAPGAQVEVDDRTGKYLKAIGKAEIVTVQVKAEAKTKETAKSKSAEKRETR